MKDLLPVLEEAAKMQKPLLLVAADVEGEALATLVVNLERGNLRCLAVRAPGSGEQRLERLHDLATLTGGVVLDPEMGHRLENAGRKHFGYADTVIVSPEQTAIVGGRGDQKMLDERISALREARTTASEHDAAILTERIARLGGAVVTVRLGANTPQELRDKRYRALSALNAASAALSGGCVPGGGRTLQLASEALDGLSERNVKLSEGIQVAQTALVSPLRAMIAAAGLDPNAIVEQLRRIDDPRIGFNARTGDVEDLMVAGILDSSQATIHGLEVAQSTAKTFLETAAWHVQAEETDRSIALDL